MKKTSYTNPGITKPVSSPAAAKKRAMGILEYIREPVLIEIEAGIDTSYNVVSARDYLPRGAVVIERWDGSQWVKV